MFPFCTTLLDNSGQGSKPKLQATGKNMLNLASSNFLGYVNNEEIKVNRET